MKLGEMGETVGVAIAARYLVIVHRAEPPDDAEWQVFVDTIVEYRDQLRGQLVYTLGGTPSSAQRQRATEAAAGVDPVPPTSVMTENRVVRHVVTALNWFFPQAFRVFRLDDWDGAFAHLEALPDEQQALRAQVEAFVGDVGQAARSREAG